MPCLSMMAWRPSRRLSYSTSHASSRTHLSETSTVAPAAVASARLIRQINFRRSSGATLSSCESWEIVLPAQTISSMVSHPSPGAAVERICGPLGKTMTVTFTLPKKRRSATLPNGAPADKTGGSIVRRGIVAEVAEMDGQTIDPWLSRRFRMPDPPREGRAVRNEGPRFPA